MTHARDALEAVAASVLSAWTMSGTPAGAVLDGRTVCADGDLLREALP